MKNLIVTLTIYLLLASCNNSDTKNAGTSENNLSTSQNKNEMVGLMDKMMEKMHAPSSTQNNDADFSNMMIEHHIGAVRMSELHLKEGKDAELRIFAQNVIEAQNKEIAVLKKYTASTGISADNKEFQQALNQSVGVMMNKKMIIYSDIDKDYAAQMIPHHQSAVEMAKAYLKFGKQPELIQLCNDIVRQQTVEIAQLQKWIDKI